MNSTTLNNATVTCCGQIYVPTSSDFASDEGPGGGSDGLSGGSEGIAGDTRSFWPNGSTLTVKISGYDSSSLYHPSIL
jgi:hypothetical protein